MPLHVVRNGILTAVPFVLQVVFFLGLVADVVGSDVVLVCTTTNAVVAHVACAGCLRRGVVRWELTQRARRQRITSARVGGAAAARRDWYIKRLDHVLTFEQQKSMLAWSKQTLIECTHPRVRQGRARLCWRSFCGIVLFSLLLLGGALRPRRARRVRLTFNAKEGAVCREPRCPPKYERAKLLGVVH
jgi:hypothetical protein